jgi:hypothetical protein
MRDTLMCIVDDDKLPYDIIIGLPDIRRHDLTTRFPHLFQHVWPTQGTRVTKDKLLTKDVDSDLLEMDDNADLPDPLPWDDMWDKLRDAAMHSVKIPTTGSKYKEFVSPNLDSHTADENVYVSDSGTMTPARILHFWDTPTNKRRRRQYQCYPLI